MIREDCRVTVTTFVGINLVCTVFAVLPRAMCCKCLFPDELTDVYKEVISEAYLELPSVTKVIFLGGEGGNLIVS